MPCLLMDIEPLENISMSHFQTQAMSFVNKKEDKRGEKDTQAGDEEFYQSRTDFIETTINSVTPKTMDGQISSSTSALGSPIASRESASACTNFKFMVLKIPCAYGYMTSANFDT